MYAAYGGNTARGIQRIQAERGALPDDAPRIVSIVDLRKKREQERAEQLLLTRKKQLAQLQVERAIANEAIRKANERLSAIREVNYIAFPIIVSRICRVLGITHLELLSDRRDRRVTFARAAVCYWACRLTRMSLPEIGRRMGGRDHTTILHNKRAYPKKRAAGALVEVNIGRSGKLRKAPPRYLREVR